MINVLHSIDTPGPGGAETVYLNIINGLDQEKFLSYPVIPSEGWLYNCLSDKGYKPIIINSSGSFSLNYLYSLIIEILRNNIDLIHSHLFGSNLYCSIAGIITRKPVISTFHGFIDAVGDRLEKSKMLIINQGSRKIVFVSNQLKKYYVDKYCLSSYKSEVVYNGIDVENYSIDINNDLRKKLGFRQRDVIIGSIGNIRSSKGYETLLKAAANVNKINKDIKFVIAGEGSGEIYEKLMKLKNKMNLNDTVYFLGFVKNTIHFLDGIDIYLLCSISEGFSLSLTEAIACGLPVIATRCGGPEEIIDIFNAGVLVDKYDIETITNEILKYSMIVTKKSYNNLNTKKIIDTPFSLTYMNRMYKSMYSGIVKQLR